MPEYSFRLWVHEAEDGLLPEVTIRASNRMQAAALALQHFLWIDRPMRLRSYLQCEPPDDSYLRIGDVLNWLRSAEGRAFARECSLAVEATCTAIVTRALEFDASWSDITRNKSRV